MDVIDISSDDEDKKQKEGTFIGDHGPIEPLEKKRKLNSDVIVLTDEEDDLLGNSNDPTKIGPETPKNNQEPSDFGEADLLEETTPPANHTDLEEEITQSGDQKTETNNASLHEEDTEEDELEDDHDEDDSTKENVGHNSNANEEAERVSDKGEAEFHQDLEDFVEVCLKNLKGDVHFHVFEDKVDVLKHTFRRASVYGNSEAFKEEVKLATKKITQNTGKTIEVFHEIYLSLKANYNEKDDCRRLWKAYEKVSRKIKKLEVAEVDFEEEENSAYIKLQRYKERATLIFKKINKREKVEPTFGRIYYGRLDYGCSDRPEINRAINRKFQDRHKIPFPSYEDVNSCIKKCVKEHNLKLTKHEIESETRLNLEQLGNLIQKRRKQDMASIHHDFLHSTVDPAKEDKELENKLNEHRKYYQQKQKEIFERFVQLQNKGNDPELSEDSDDSHKEESEPEEEAEEHKDETVIE